MAAAETVQQIADAVADKIGDALPIVQDATAMLVSEVQFGSVIEIMLSLLFIAIGIALIYLGARWVKKADYHDTPASEEGLYLGGGWTAIITGGITIFVSVISLVCAVCNLAAPHIYLLKTIVGYSQ